MGVLSKALKPVTGPGIFWPQDYPALDAVGVAKSVSGVSVSADAAWGLPAFFASVRNLSEDVAKLPCITYERVTYRPAGDGRPAQEGKRRASDHPLYAVLHDTANPEMTAFVWRETSMGHLLTWGNSYSEIQRNRLGQIVALWPIPPHRVTPKRDDQDRRFYRVRNVKPDADGRYDTDLTPDEVFHVPGLGYDGLIGYNPIDLMAKAIGVGLAAQEHAERFWANNARPGGVLEVPKDIAMSDNAKNKLKAQFTAAHQGLTNAQRVAMLEDGITFKEIGIPPETAQFLETRKFQVTEIARMMRVPPHKIGDLERATFSNIEQQALEYVQDSLGGWLARIEAQARKDLFGPGAFFAEFLVDGLLRADILTRYRAYSIGRLGGWLTPNNILNKENMEPRLDDGGDEYMLPLNVTAEGGPDAGAPTPPPGSLGPAEDVMKMTITAVPDRRTGNGAHAAEVAA